MLFSGTLHSVGFIFPFLPAFCFSSFLSLPRLFLKPPQTTTLPSCISISSRWFWSLSPVQFYEAPSIVLQAFCLPDLIPWIYSSPPLYKGFDLGHTWMVFPGGSGGKIHLQFRTPGLNPWVWNWFSGMATHSSILAWRIPWTGEHDRLQFMELHRVRHNWAANTHTWMV